MMYWREQNKFYVESMDGNFEIRRSYVKRKKIVFHKFFVFRETWKTDWKE